MASSRTYEPSARIRSIEAHARERYPGLIVRVGGFSSRFMNLSRNVQQEIIARRRWQ